MILLFSCCCLNIQAQENDTLFAVKKGLNLNIRYTVKPGEYLQMLANRFYIPAETLEKLNLGDPNKKLQPDNVLYIPILKDNYSSQKPPIQSDEYRELYYRVGERDDIGLIATYAGVTKRQLITWNDMKGNSLVEGQPLFIGWLRMVAKDSASEAIGLAYPAVKKTITNQENIVVDTQKHDFNGLDKLFDMQTSNGTNVLTEKGTAVFFEKGGKGGVQYAFHNTAQRGSVIKVFNPGTGKYTYVKVIGPIPDTKQYANCIIGISSGAKEALGILDNKAWCELSYPAN